MSRILSFSYFEFIGLSVISVTEAFLVQPFLLVIFALLSLTSTYGDTALSFNTTATAAAAAAATIATTATAAHVFLPDVLPGAIVLSRESFPEDILFPTSSTG